MKTNVRNMAIAMFALSTVFLGCEKDTTVPMSGDKTASVENRKDLITQSSDETKTFEHPIGTELKSGKWRIVNFNNDAPYGLNYTGLFAEYTFNFYEGNLVLVEKKDHQSYSGKWNLYEQDGRLNLAFSFGIKPFISINDRWAPVAYTTTRVRLERPGTDGTDHLDFEKVEELPAK